MYALIAAALSAGLVALAAAGCRRGPLRLTLGLLIAVPVLLTPLWVYWGPEGVFPGTKLYTILLSALWVTALRLKLLGESRTVLAYSMLMLPLNILEAVGRDLSRGTVANGAVATAGLLLLLPLRDPSVGMAVDSSGPYRDLVSTGITRPWIIAYSVWNGTFVYVNYPFIAFHEWVVLAVPLAIGLSAPGLWLQSRTYTLAADLAVLATFWPMLEGPLDSTAWATPSWQNAAAAVCLTWVVGYVIASMLRRRASASRPDDAPRQC